MITKLIFSGLGDPIPVVDVEGGREGAAQEGEGEVLVHDVGGDAQSSAGGGDLAQSSAGGGDLAQGSTIGEPPREEGGGLAYADVQTQQLS